MRLLPGVVFISSVFLTSCTSDDPKPTAPLVLVPVEMVEEDFSKRFVYSNSGQLTQIKLISPFANGGLMESQHNFFYDQNGRITETTTDTGWRFVYTFLNNKIIRTDEYVNGTLSQHHTFTYNNKGLLAERITWQNIPEEGGEIPVAKDAYEYNQNDNVTTQRLYYYTSFGAEAKVLTTFTFSEYDTKINSENYFDVNTFNPLIILRKNNPGKLEIRNAKNEVGTSEVYTYEYHPIGYVVKKTTNVTYYHGGTGSYVSSFRFKE